LKRVFAVLLCLSAVAVAQQAAPNQKALTIEAIFAPGSLTGRGPEVVKWSPDSTKVSFIQRDDSGERGELWYVDLASGKKAVLVAADKLSALAPPSSRIKDERERDNRQRYSVAAYHWAPDSKHLLFDALGQLWLYSVERGVAVQLTSHADPAGDPKFSPDGSRISYVRKHNLYVRRVDGGKEKQLTKSASEDELNGEVDWVYAEELDVRSNYFWSPDGEHIAFLQMDEKPVPTFPITDFIPTHATLDMQKYPKAGDPNPIVRIGVVESGGGGVKWLKVGDPKEKNFYIPRFGWVRDGLLWVQMLNRAQNRLELYFVDTRSGQSQLMLSETSDAWVPVSDDFRILQSGDRFLWSSWRDGHTHLYLYSFDKQEPLNGAAKLQRQLTSGDFEVFKVDGMDDEAGVVYFTANQGDARRRGLYSVRLDSAGFRRISPEPGSYSAEFAPDAKHYLITYSALMTPPHASACQVGGDCTLVWQARPLDEYGLVQPQFVDFTAEDGTVLHGLLLLPPGAQPGAKAPLILNPYGGPGAQTVRDAWGGSRYLYHVLMARRGFAVLQVDNRGMGGRSRQFQAQLLRRFGEVELQDQLAALKQALERFPVLDGSRVGIWGWSYGGFLTTYAMTHSGAFRAGVAVAPVTDWRLYDTIYTERYMGLPKENAEGYLNSSPVNAAKELRGRLLMAHGTSDDNVHLQNTVQMANKFIEAGKLFDVQLYPRKTHAIAGTAASVHLYTTMTQHFERYLMAGR
jgi:dipeptidyl-peptidase-4